MKVTLLVASILFVLMFMPSSGMAQYLSSSLYYTQDFAGYSIPSPSNTYQSLRLQSLSPAFAGLITDRYTDLFYNPAFASVDTSDEILGDIGSPYNGGPYFFGGSYHLSEGCLSAYADVYRVQNNSSTSSYYSSGSSVNYSDNSSNTSSSRLYGGIINYCYTRFKDISLAAAYQYKCVNSPYYSEDDYSMYYLPLYPDSSYHHYQKVNRATLGHFNKLTLGATEEFDKSVLALKLTGLFSSYTVSDDEFTFYVYHYPSRPNQSDTVSYLSPQEIRTTGGQISINYRTKITQQEQRNCLLEIAYTSYDVTNLFTETEQVSSSIFSHGINRESKGSIFDLKGGIAWERSLGEQFTSFFGITFSYIRNTAGWNYRYMQPPQSYDGEADSKNSSGFEIIAPLGIEIHASNIVTFRGGFEPKYSTSDVLSTSSYDDTYSNHDRSTEGLSLRSNFGLGLMHPDVGELNVLFSNVFTDTRTWSFSVRYFL